MAFSSYRAFLDKLAHQGELIRIAGPVATELEITEIADREMKKTGGGKALLFEKPTINGEISPFPVVINTMGTRRRMAMAASVIPARISAGIRSAVIGSTPCRMGKRMGAL